MRRLYTSFVLVVLLGLALNLTAQQTPKSRASSSAQTPSQDQTLPSAQEAQRPTDRQNQQTARSFEGKITKSGGKLVLQELATETNYQLDDQLKAKRYEGRVVKVMATMNPSSNTLHVVSISPISK